MGKYVCIGWGSLIWNPGDLPIRNTWNCDGPLLGVEFLRHSSRDRLTLVLSDTAPLVQTQWATLDLGSLTDAKAVLKQREGVPLGWIGYWPGTSTTNAEQAVAAWAIERGFDGAVWTASPPKWNDANGNAPTEAEAIAWLIALGDRQAPAREYIEKAPASVRTPYREAFERELRRMPQLSA